MGREDGARGAGATWVEAPVGSVSFRCVARVLARAELSRSNYISPPLPFREKSGGWVLTPGWTDPLELWQPDGSQSSERWGLASGAVGVGPPAPSAGAGVQSPRLQRPSHSENAVLGSSFSLTCQTGSSSTSPDDCCPAPTRGRVSFSAWQVLNCSRNNRLKFVRSLCVCFRFMET